VINHGKKKYWLKREPSYHYHVGLEAGENTLEAQLTRLVIRTINREGPAFTFDKFRQEYIKFMRTPGSHNDAYASSAHRLFFEKLVNGVAPEEC